MSTFFIFKIMVVMMVILCGVHDMRHLTIPNKYVGVILGLFPVACFLNMSSLPLASHLIAMAIVFGISLILYSLKLMGGGDSKMAAGVGLWVGLGGLGSFIVSMAITGGVLAAIALYFKQNNDKIPPYLLKYKWFNELQQKKSVVPYGVAIAVGTIIGLF